MPSFRELTNLIGRCFYQGHHSLNYAQARYLLYTLQEGGLLVRYYRLRGIGASARRQGHGAIPASVGRGDAEAEGDTS